MAANRERGELPLEVNGKEYILKLTTNAMCELETKLDRTFDSVMAGMQAGRISDLRIFLWAMLQEYHADEITSPEAAGRIVDDAGGILAVQKKLQATYELNTKEARAKAGKKKPKTRKTGTGATSTSKAEASV